jgi:cysteine desulfurase
VGFGAAAERARETLPAAAAAVRELRDAFERGLLRAIPEAHVVAGRSARLPNTSLVLIPGADTEALLALLDMAGLCCSSGSACASGSHEPSHVLQAMGLGSDRSFAVLRVSLSRYNDLNEIDYLVRQVQTSLASLRAQRGPAPREGNFSH